MKTKEFIQKTKSILGLSFQLAMAGFKQRNEGSYLGIFWYLLGPLLTFGLLLAVFSTRLGNNIQNYPLYLLSALIMFNLFQFATTESSKIVSLYRGIIKSINFDLETTVGATVLKALFSHIFEVVVFAAVMIFFNVSLKGLLFYPFILVVFIIFIFGISLILASLTVYFTDLENIWIFVSRLLWLATPIFYAIGGQDKLFALNLFNPMYYFITVSRDLLIYGKMPELWLIQGMIFYSFISLFIGVFIFNSLKGKFAEMI